MTYEVKFRLVVEGAGAVVTDTNRVGGSLQQVGAQSRAAAAHSESLASALGRVAHYGLAGGALAGLVGTAKQAAAAMFTASATAQRLGTQLDFATDGKGAQSLAFVTDLANKLGLELKVTAKAYAGFASAARGTALEGEKTQAVFTSMAKASAVMSLSADETRGALLAVQQMMSKGVVSAEEFRGQLGERMPIALQAGAKALGVTTAEFSKLLETGKIISEDFLPKFGKAIDDALGNAAEKAAARLDASVARMANAFEKLKQQAGDSGVSKALAEGAEELTDTMQAMTLSMEIAARNGGGSLRQMTEAASTFIARSFGLQDVLPFWSTYTERLAHADARVREAEASLARLTSALDEQPGNILLAGAERDAQRLVIKLREAQVALKQVNESAAETARLAGTSPLLGGVSPSEDAKVARQAAAAKSRGEVLAKYASDAQKLRDELEKVAAAFGGVIPKDLEQQIRAKFTKPTQEARSAFADLSGDIRKTIDVINLRNAAGGELSKAQQLEIDLTHRLTEALGKLKPGEVARLRAMIAEAAAAQSLGDAIADQAKARDAANKAASEYLDSLDARAKTAEDETQRLRDQYIELTAGKQVLAELINLREEERAVALERMADETPWAEEAERLRLVAARLREQIALRKGIASATDSNEVDAANKVAADRALQDWQRTADQIGQSLTDQLMQGGKSGAEYVKNLFRTMVLRPVIQGIVQPVAGAVAGFLGQGAPAGAAGASGTLQNAQALYQAYNALSSGSSIAGGVGTAVFGNSAAYGAAIGTTNVGAGSQAAMLAAQTGEFGLAGNVATSQAAAGAGSGAASMMSAGAYAAVIIAASNAAARDFRNGFNEQSARQIDGVLGPLAKTTSDLGDVLRKIGISNEPASILSGETLVSKLFGRSSRVSVEGRNIVGNIGASGFDGTFDTRTRQKGGVFRSDKVETFSDVLSGDIDRAIDDTSALLRTQAKKYGAALGLPVEAIDSVVRSFNVDVTFADQEEAIKRIQAELGKYGESLLETFAPALDGVKRMGETTSQTIERLGAAIKGANEVLGLLRVPLLDASVAGGKAADDLARAFGGLEQLTQASSTYYSEFFSDAERAADSTKAMTQALAGVGLQVPATREAFKAMVSGLDLTNEGQREQFRVLMQVSGAFAELHPVLQETAVAARSASDILQERKDLEMQLLRLQGDTAAIREIERRALDASNRSLYDQVRALEDAQATQTAAKALADEATARAQATAQEAAGLQQRWLQLTGDTAALRTLELDALAPVNRELLARIHLLEDEQAAQLQAAAAIKDAQAKAAADAEDALAKAAAVAKEAQSLEQRWLQLTGDTAALRAMELEALAPVNRELLERIHRLEDEKTAADLAKRAAEDAINQAREFALALEDLNRAFASTVDQMVAGASSAWGQVQSSIADARAGVVSQAAAEIQALDKQTADTESAFAKLQSSLSGLVDTLLGAADTLLGANDAGQARQNAKANLRAMLAGARGGSPIDVDEAGKAASVVSRLDSGEFSSRTDYLRETLQSAALLQDLAGAAKGQVSAAQRAADENLSRLAGLKKAIEVSRDQQTGQLDQQLELARQQYEALTGVDTRVATLTSVMESFAGFLVALGVAKGGDGPTNQWLQSGDGQVWRSSAGATATSAVGAPSEAVIKGKTGAVFTARDAQAWVNDRVNAGDLAAISSAAIREGIDSTSLDALMGWAPGTSLRGALANGLPAFAAGGMHAGGLRLVGERGPEIEATGAARIWNAQDTAAMLGNGGRRDEVLVAEIKALRQEVSMLRADARAQQASIASHANKTATLLDKFDVDGMPPVRT